MKIGLVGCGRVAGIHMHAYSMIENAHVVAVADLDVERAKAFANVHNIQRTFQNYDDLLEIKDLDFVDVCTPTSTHCRIICDVVNFGHNALVEKPMALSTSDCDKMITESKRNGTILCVCHNQLFAPSIIQARSIVDSESFDLISFKTTHKESFKLLKSLNLAQGWNITPEQKGILWEVGCHQAYLQLSFLGDIRKVYAVGDKVEYPVYDEYSVLLQTGDRRHGIMEVSWLAMETEVVYEFSSSEGRRIQVHLDNEYLLEKSKKPPYSISNVLREVYVDQKRIFNKWMNFAINYVRKRKLESHLNLITKYIESLENGNPPPVTPEEGRSAIKLLESIKKSLDDHQEVTLTD